jgi:predicted permease
VIGVLSGFVTIGIVIGVGALVAHLGLVDLSAQLILSKIAFFVATPALLVKMLSETHIGDVLSGNLVATAVGAIVPFLVYAVVAARLWHRRPGDRVIGALSSGYVNAGNLGIPVAAYALGNASYVVPTLLLQLLLFQPAALALLDADGSGRSPRVSDFVLRPLKNPLTLGTIAGLVLAATGWIVPAMLWHPIELIGAMAVPAMLLAYGVSLRLGPRFGGGVPAGELALASALKLVIQPAIAYAVAHFALGLSGHALLAVVVCSALPTAQNIFVHATRYDRATTLARDTILVTTLGSVPVILLITLLLGG